MAKKFERINGLGPIVYYFNFDAVTIVGEESEIHPGYYEVRVDGVWLYLAQADYLRIKSALGIP